MSEQYCEIIKIFRKNLYFKRCCIQVVFRVALLWNKCYFWLCYFQLAVFLCLFNFCFLYLGVLWIFNWNVNSSKLFTDDDQFYNFMHFSFFTLTFRLYQNTGQKTVQTNNKWYLQKGKKIQIISKVYFVKYWMSKLLITPRLQFFFLAKNNSLKKMWSGYISFLTDNIGSCGWKSPLRKNYVERKLFFVENNLHLLTIEIAKEQTVDFKNILQFFLKFTLKLGKRTL